MVGRAGVQAELARTATPAARDGAAKDPNNGATRAKDARVRARIDMYPNDFIAFSVEASLSEEFPVGSENSLRFYQCTMGVRALHEPSADRRGPKDLLLKEGPMPYDVDGSKRL